MRRLRAITGLRTLARLMLAAAALVFAVVGLQTPSGSASPDSSAHAAGKFNWHSPAPLRRAEHPAAPGKPGPAEVFAGVYISNIQHVDMTTNSFDADFYVWLRWSDPEIDPTVGMEVMNPYQSWGLVVTPVYDEPQEQNDGSLLWLVRYQGSFTSPLSLSDYPFETQTLRLLIEDGEQSARNIVYKADEDPIALDREVTLPGFRFGQPRATFGTYTYDSAFGQRGATVEDRTYPRITVEIPLSSPAVSGVVKTVLPVIIVLIASALALVIPASYVDSKLNVCITALLALVAMHWGVTSGLPDTTYLLMIDVLFILAYLATTAMLAASVLGGWVLHSRGEAASMAVQRRGLLVIAVGYLVSLVVVLLLYLPEGWFG